MKYSLILLLLLSLLTAFQFVKTEKSFPAPANNFSCDALKGKIFALFASMDSIKDNYPKGPHRDDLIDTLNQKVIRALRDLSTNDHFTYCSLNTPYKFGYILSADHNLCLISWDSRNGSPETDYRTVAIYKTDNGTRMEVLKNSDASSKIYFDSLFTVVDPAGKTFYVADGFTHESDKLMARKIKALQITDALVDSIPLFPESESSPGFVNETTVEYNTGNFSETDKPLPIQFLNTGQMIKIPQTDNNDVPTGKYTTLQFDGKKYKRK